MSTRAPLSHPPLLALLRNLATTLSPCSQLSLQCSPLAPTLGPRQQLQQTIMMECLSAYGEPPQLALRFSSPASPAPLQVYIYVYKYVCVCVST